MLIKRDTRSLDYSSLAFAHGLSCARIAGNCLQLLLFVVFCCCGGVYIHLSLSHTHTISKYTPQEQSQTSKTQTREHYSPKNLTLNPIPYLDPRFPSFFGPHRFSVQNGGLFKKQRSLCQYAGRLVFRVFLLIVGAQHVRLNKAMKMFQRV